MTHDNEEPREVPEGQQDDPNYVPPEPIPINEVIDEPLDLDTYIDSDLTGEEIVPEPEDAGDDGPTPRSLVRYTTYSAAQAATRSKQYSTWRTNYCLNFVRNMLTPTVSSPYSLPSATQAWYYAQKKVTTGVPPAGAPVYWKSFSHPYGHIAVSLGGGYVRSTDWPGKGQVGTVAISRLTSAWGQRYLGWSRDYAGLTIRGLETATTATIPAPVNYSESTAYVVNDEALRAMSEQLRQRIDRESHVLFGTARLWDDGVIDPRDSRRVLALVLALWREAEARRLRPNAFGVARF